MTSFTWDLRRKESIHQNGDAYTECWKVSCLTRAAELGEDVIVAVQVEGASSKNSSFILWDHEIWEGSLVKAKDDKLDGGWITCELTFCVGKHELHPVGTRKSLEHFNWRSDMIIFHWKNIVFMAVGNIY